MEKTYRMKPSVVLAIYWTGANWAEVEMFVPAKQRKKDGSTLKLASEDGWRTARRGSWIVQGRHHFYTVPDSMFRVLYEVD